ncbi:3-keto-disaccharide hydrolase [Neptunicella sp. SCSIO 80796]|uniref:3-keto-disaccharide hydrolase n=1 Tax=Neptunicella plasticusilytica TaxID=3117012 RepID=UPI003A4D21C6
MKLSIFLFVSCLFCPLVSAAQWQPLLDKNLSHWDIYLSYKHKETYDGSIPLDEHGQPVAPIGLNTGNDTYQVFTVIEQDNQPVLRVSGEIYGAVTSKASYRNYHLKLQFRWGEKKWPPRENKLRDSGILYHAIGEHGQEYYRAWMLSQEFQIMRGHIGDYWQQATSAIDIRAYQPEYIMNPVADESQPFLKVGHGEQIKGFVLRKENAEKPFGEWNTLELICFEGQSLHIVNGQVVMVLKNSRYQQDGVSKPLVEGKIQLQSEAAEIFYRQIEIRTLDQLPAPYTKLFN